MPDLRSRGAGCVLVATSLLLPAAAAAEPAPTAPAAGAELPAEAAAGAETPFAAEAAAGGEAVSGSSQGLLALVLALVPRRVEPGLARTLGEVVASELARRDELRVTTLADLDAMFAAERLKDLTGCEDVACVSEVSGALGADRILAGSVGRLDDRLVLTLHWIDAVYATPLTHVSRVAAGEAALAAAVPGAVAELLQESAQADAQARRRKSRPTFWTAELAGNAGWRSSPEPYDLDLGGAVRVAWGGRPRGVDLYFYALAGLGVGHLRGEANDRAGRIRYSRTQIVPFVELRAAMPVANRNRTRLYASGGAGLGFELYGASQQDGLEPRGTLRVPELRFGCGLWHRWSALGSFFGGYQLRAHLAGDGADSVSELVEVGSTRSVPVNHAFELGWAMHF